MAAGSGIVWWRAAAALVVALALQVAVNYANDLSDGLRGTDGQDRVGPQRLLGSGLATPQEVRLAMLAPSAWLLWPAASGRQRSRRGAWG